MQVTRGSRRQEHVRMLREAACLQALDPHGVARALLQVEELDKLWHILEHDRFDRRAFRSRSKTGPSNSSVSHGERTGFILL